MSKCPKRQEVKDTSVLRPRSGNWYSITLLYSNGQVVTKPDSNGEAIDLFLKGRSVKEFGGHIFKLTEFQTTKMVERGTKRES